MGTEKELETKNQKPETSKRWVWLTRYLPLFVWIMVIFFLSSSQGSMGQTSRIIGPLLEFLFPSASPETLVFYHGLIRKLAHLTEYALLGVLAARAFIASLLNNHPFVFAFALVLFVATIDEIQQSFNPARTGSPVDVLIDLSGGAVALLVFYLVRRRARGATTG